MRLRRSASFQVYRHVDSSTSDSSESSTSSKNSDTPLRRFNRLVRASVARHWAYFRKDRPALRARGRSVSDAGLCSFVDDDPEMDFLALPTVPTRRSLQAFGSGPCGLPIFISSAGGSSCAVVGVEEASDGSDAEHTRRSHHLRVPTPALPGHDVKRERPFGLPTQSSKNCLQGSSSHVVQSNRSTGNFASGAAGGGCGAPRSAPATPLQLEPHPRTKHDKHVVKPLSGSAPSVRVSPTTVETTDGKQPSKSRQKKFQRHFPQVGPEERVLNYYSCALVGDLLLQGHLYITKNYFAFYSNVFGYVTKLLIPTTSVLRITKEKVARIIPNAVGVCTRDERHVFGSLLSRDSTYKLMTHVWKAARVPDIATPKPEELRASEAELDASEYSPEDDSSSAGGDAADAPAPAPADADAIISAAGAAVIQPALLTGAPAPRRTDRCTRALFVLLALALACSALVLAYRLHRLSQDSQESLAQLSSLSGAQLYGELVRARARLHGRAAAELHAFLTTNLLLLTKVRQSLEALSGVILTDMAHAAVNDVPNETAFS